MVLTMDTVYNLAIEEINQEIIQHPGFWLFPIQVGLLAGIVVRFYQTFMPCFLGKVQEGFVTPSWYFVTFVIEVCWFISIWSFWPVAHTIVKVVKHSPAGTYLETTKFAFLTWETLQLVYEGIAGFFTAWIVNVVWIGVEKYSACMLTKSCETGSLPELLTKFADLAGEDNWMHDVAMKLQFVILALVSYGFMWYMQRSWTRNPIEPDQNNNIPPRPRPPPPPPTCPSVLPPPTSPAPNQNVVDPDPEVTEVIGQLTTEIRRMFDINLRNNNNNRN